MIERYCVPTSAPWRLRVVGSCVRQKGVARDTRQLGGDLVRWQDEIHRDAECLLLIKTRASLYAHLETRLLALHPYELPELLAVPVDTGLAGYLQWIQDNTQVPTT